MGNIIALLMKMITLDWYLDFEIILNSLYIKFSNILIINKIELDVVWTINLLKNNF